MVSPEMILNEIGTKEAKPALELRDMKRYLLRRISPDESYSDLLSFPRFFEIETVNACNARCPMCTIDDWDRRDGLMSDELFSKITKEISEHSNEVRRVHLYRDGEPLLDKKLPQKVKMMKEAGVREVGISTNIALLSEKKSADLLEAGLDSIILSIDSLRSEVYEKIRLGLKFGEVMTNAFNFIRLRNEGNYPTKVWVRMIRQESNYDEWPDYERYWKSQIKPTDRVDFKLLHNWGGQLKGHESDFTSGKPCVALWSLMCIFADGKVPMCNVDYNNKYPLGDINIQSIQSLWHSRAQLERRKFHLDGRRSEIGLCTNCTAWDEFDNNKQ
jgi:MoaA/NifB/PqqE/SkfB family radical SAM enzyme